MIVDEKKKVPSSLTSKKQNDVQCNFLIYTHVEVPFAVLTKGPQFNFSRDLAKSSCEPSMIGGYIFSSRYGVRYIRPLMTLVLELGTATGVTVVFSVDRLMSLLGELSGDDFGLTLSSSTADLRPLTAPLVRGTVWDNSFLKSFRLVGLTLPIIGQ